MRSIRSCIAVVLVLCLSWSPVGLCATRTNTFAGDLHALHDNIHNERVRLDGSMEENSFSQRQDATKSFQRNVDRIALLTPYGRIVIRLDTENAPKTVNAIVEKIKSDPSCNDCEFYRAEARPSKNDPEMGPPYGLLQGELNIPQKLTREGKASVRAGDVALITGSTAFYIALIDHQEWGSSHTVFGKVEDFVSTDLIAIQPYHQVKHPEFGTIMRMMDEPVPFSMTIDMGEIVMPVERFRAFMSKQHHTKSATTSVQKQGMHTAQHRKGTHETIKRQPIHKGQFDVVDNLNEAPEIEGDMHGVLGQGALNGEQHSREDLLQKIHNKAGIQTKHQIKGGRKMLPKTSLHTEARDDAYHDAAENF